MDEARQGERAGASESIEANVRNFPEESHVHGVTQTIPGENGAAGKRATWTKPVRANERERVSQSK